METLKIIIGVVLLIAVLAIGSILLIPFIICFFVLMAFEFDNKQTTNKYNSLLTEKSCINCKDYIPTIEGIDDEYFDYSKGFCKNYKNKISNCTSDSVCIYYDYKQYNIN